MECSCENSPNGGNFLHSEIPTGTARPLPRDLAPSHEVAEIAPPDGNRGRGHRGIGRKCALSRALEDLWRAPEPIVLGVGRTVFTYI